MFRKLRVLPLQSIFLLIVYLLNFIKASTEDRILGCNGFIRSDLAIDFSKVEVKLISKEGNLKDRIECAPNNGYFFLPLYDKGEYSLQISSIYKWVFEPLEFKVNFNGIDDPCSQGKDIIFTFVGFRVFGKVNAADDKPGPKGINITLIANLPDEQKEISSVQTEEGGRFEVSPVLPGSYTIKAWHPKWLMRKHLVTFAIEKSNFEVPRNSLLFAGYPVSGWVVSSGEPISGVNFVLYSVSNTTIIRTHGCKHGTPEDFDDSDLKLTNVKSLCYVISNEKGAFAFAAVPSGDYVLVPYYKGANSLKFEVHPRVVRFTVLSDSYMFSKPFLVSGFSVLGRVLSATTNGKPIAGVKVVLDKEKVVETNSDGSFVFDGVKTGLHNIQIKGDDYQFKDSEIKIAPNSAVLDTIYPTGFKICGHVHKLQPVQIVVIFTEVVSSEENKMQINNDGSYCLYLAPGTYAVKVLSPGSQSDKLLWFFPINHSVKVTDKPLKDVNFRQETAQLTGTVECDDDNHVCEESKVVLRGLGSVEEEYNQMTKNGKYNFVDLYPGHYELSVANQGKWCWEYSSQKIYISEVQNKAPAFKRIGISFMVSSSHDTNLKYRKLTSNETISKEGTLDIKRGVRQYCLPGDAIYQLEPLGCHRYAEPLIRWEVRQDTLKLNAISHETTAIIISPHNVDDITVRLYVNNDQSPTTTIGPLKGKKEGSNFEYKFSFQAAVNELLTIVPGSSSVFFTPANLTVHGAKDCIELGERIYAKLGIRFEGTVQPALENVEISVRNEMDVVVTSMLTDVHGKYKFGPLQSDQKYKVDAVKEGYIISGPFENGVFKAHKLAEIRVDLVDDDGKSLQGVLLSLSGGDNYRQTSQSNVDGKITFLSLKPGEYYLRPMLKEYKFSPPSKVTNIQEGATVTVTFKGHRVLYSVFGHVHSLSHFPEKEIVIEAISKTEGECVLHQEEGTTDENGYYRIRGLKPQCSYDVRLKKGSLVNKKIRTSLPETIGIKMSSNDIENIDLIAIPEATQSDVSVFLESTSPDHLRSVILRLLDDDGGLLHTFKLNDWKMTRYTLKNVLLPLTTLPLNAKNYQIRLESSLPKSTYMYETQTFYFSANTTFQLLKIKFAPELRLPDSDIKHSYASAVLILLLGVSYWCKDTILAALSQLQNNSGVTVSEFLNRYSQQAPPSKGKEIEKTFIEFEPGLTVVKRKIKPRKM